MKRIRHLFPAVLLLLAGVLSPCARAQDPVKLSDPSVTAVTPANNDFVGIYRTGQGSSAKYKVNLGVFLQPASLSANAQTWLGAADYAAMRALLDLEAGTDFNAYDVDLTTYASITPAANVQSLLGAANYAAIRALLDLEAGTDFYSLAGADAAFQALEPTLTDIADGTIAENLVNTANPWAVNEGGTGAGSLTDGGVLLGSGTGPVTPMAVLADGEMIVGDGTTDPVAESGATLRTSIGLGTSNTASFATLITSAGVLTGNGDILTTGDLDLLADGDDVNIGASTSTDSQRLRIFDGGSDNEPGSVTLYDDAGNPWTLFMSSAGALRIVQAATVTDDDTDGAEVGAVDGITESETFVIMEPDLVQAVTDDVVLKKFAAEMYPGGVTVTAIHIDASAAYAGETFLFQHWDDAAGSTQATVESIACSAISTEDDGTLADATIPADFRLVVNLDDAPEDVAYVAITVVWTY